MKVFKHFVISLILLLFVCCSYNFYVDKLGVFGNKYKFIMHSSSMHNEAFVKKQFLIKILKDNARFQNFLLGSENAMKMNIDDFPGLGWYSYTDFFKTPYDMLEDVNFLTGVTKVDKLVIFLEPEYLYIDKLISDKQKDSYLNYKCPDDIKGKIIFYLKYLYKNPFYKEKEQLSIREKLNLFYDGSHIGALNNRLSDFNTINIDRNINYSSEKIDDLISVLNQIVNFCRDNQIKLTVVLTPQYSDKMSYFNTEHIKTFKKRLSEISDYYDFWTNNQINENKNSFNSNYFMTFETAQKLLNRIFYEKNDNSEIDNFGQYIVKGKYYEK